ncbi:tetratricopeptide repeat protein [Carboxylicivirga marina]|uniref:Tetratricopeptide repeat protein n=1 Tax=Carboxylicivirga marina TaxID=2800988 RepID=A0ABS1HF52_9BACT|nr:hypothetical protein [Carboxylicivirga marina]MBK3515923.1 hypothetical protein [Carboxylicivirga marina]
MKKVIIILTAAILVACNPTAKLPSLQTGADAAFEQADYNTAYTMYSEYINLANANGVEVSNELYLKQAQSCAQLDKVDEAASIYSELLKDDGNIKLVAEYAQMLQSNAKVDEEIALWTNNAERITDNKLAKLKTERLVFLNSSKEDYAAVMDAYTNKGDATLSKEAQLEYIKALEASKKGSAAVKACNALIKANPDYKAALDWKAKYYYEKAEKRYKYEMAKYNKNKNATTYAYLRRDLKKVSADFRIARDTLLKLRKMEPTNKSYIRYLKNTYLRLDQKDKAAQLDKLLK